MVKLFHKPTVAIVIPIFNPPARWDENCLEHIISLRSLHPEYNFHFCLVNDGSSSNIFRKLHRNLKKSKIPHITYNLKKNYGKGRALRVGVDGAKKIAEYFICVDWDFPFGVLVIGDIVRKMEEGYELVMADRGSEYLQKIPLKRSFLTRMWRILIKRYFKLNIIDTQGGVKGFGKKAAALFLQCEIDTFMHALEFTLKCNQHNIKTATIKVYLAGGIKLSDFSFSTYWRELRMLARLIRSYDKKNNNQR